MISEKQEWVLSYIFQKFRQCKMRSSIKIRRLFCRKLNQTWIVVGRPGLEEKEERELIKESSARFRLPRLTNKRFALSFRQSKNIGSFAIIAISGGGLFPPSIFVPQTTTFWYHLFCIIRILRNYFWNGIFPTFCFSLLTPHSYFIFDSQCSFELN